MADVKNVMGVSADDIKSIMGVDVGDIKTIVGLDWPASGPAWLGGRHVLAGNAQTVSKREIDYKSSTSDSNTADWGDLIYGGASPRGTGTGVSSTKGLVGSRFGISTNIDDYDVLTISTTDSAADGGDLVPDAISGYGMSNGTLMFFAGGSTSGGFIADMDYITIASEGGSTDAGDISTALRKGGSTSGDTRGGRFGGSTGLSDDGYANYTIITADYITFHTTNNASVFGNLSNMDFLGSACASTTRWVHKTANKYTNATGHILYERMDYWAADTGGEAGNFGNVVDVSRGTSAMSDGTRGEFWGGEDGDGSNIIDQIAYITIASESDATDVGDLYHGINKAEAAGLSGSA